MNANIYNSLQTTKKVYSTPQKFGSKYTIVDPVKKIVRKIEHPYVPFLNNLPWTYWCTGTTVYECTLKSARRLMEAYHCILSQNGVNSNIFWVAEPNELRDGHHLHFLLYTPSDLRYRQYYQLWQVVTGMQTKHKRKWKRKGWSRITLERYRKAWGAGKYCTKYITKSRADYDIIMHNNLVQSVT